MDRPIEMRNPRARFSRISAHLSREGDESCGSRYIKSINLVTTVAEKQRICLATSGLRLPGFTCAESAIASSIVDADISQGRRCAM